MNTTRWVMVGMLFVCACGPKLTPQEKQWRSECSALIDASGQAARTNDRAAHALAAARLTNWIARGTIRSLDVCRAPLAGAIERDGLAPHLGALIEITYRFERTGRKPPFAKVNLDDVVASDNTVLIREAPGVYRPVSAAVAQQVARAAVNEIGIDLIRHGDTPGDILRELEIAEQCERASSSTVTPAIGCNLGGGGPGGGGGKPGLGSLGGASGVAACVASMAPSAAAEAMETMDAMEACASGGPTNPRATGAVASILPHENDTFKERLQSYEYKGTTSYTKYGWDENGGLMEGHVTEHTYKSDSSTITVMEVEVTKSGDTTTEYAVVQQDNDVKVTTQMDAQGRITGVQTERGDQLQIDSYTDGVLTKSETFDQSDQRLTVTTYDSGGNAHTTVAEYNSAIGGFECKSGCDDESSEPTAPLNEMPDPTGDDWFPGCDMGLLDDAEPPAGVGHNEGATDPNPLDPPADATSCITDGLLVNGGSGCGPSVALCVSAQTTASGSCGCGTIGGGGISIRPDGALQCARMNCGDGGSCDGATGMCATPRGGLIPGVRGGIPTPIGPIDVITIHP